MDTLLGVLLGLVVGAGSGWSLGSSRSKSSVEKTIRDLENRVKGAVANLDATQKQATIFQQENNTLKSQQDKLYSERINVEGVLKALESQLTSTQEQANALNSQVFSLTQKNEKSVGESSRLENELVLAKERLEEAQKKIQDLQKEIATLNTQSQKLTTENNSLKISLGTSESEKNIKQEAVKSLEDQLTQLKSENKQELQLLKQQNQHIVDGLKQQMSETFKVLASEVLKEESKEFKSKAEEDLTHRQRSIEITLKPVQDNLIKLEKEIQELEKERTGSYRELKSQVESLIQLEKDLRQETGNLVKALRQPIGRGQWGEVILEKVLQLSGMVENIHYMKQVSSTSSDGTIRPDVVVNLPNGKNIVIDSKAVMSAYLDALELKDDTEIENAYKNHASQLKARVNDLSKKEYFAQFQASPEFVILFLPAESLFSYALQFDKELLEYASSKNVILATPTTLIGLLRAVYYGWKQDEIARNAKEIGQSANEIYDRLAKMIEHFNNLGKSIRKSGEMFDKTAGSFNGMLRPSLNRLKAKIGKQQDENLEIDQVDIVTKNFCTLDDVQD
jgi:DNA recombination protein RmuC